MASVCGTLKRPVPGRHLDRLLGENFTFHNGPADACITVTLVNTNSSFGMVAAAYSSGYNPADPVRCDNYLADAGFVAGDGAPASRSFSFNVASNATFFINTAAGGFSVPTR